MIILDNIYENLIAELIIIVLSFLFSKFFPNLFSKEKNHNIKTGFDMFKLLVFLLSVSILNLILNFSFWNNQPLTIFLTLISCAFFISAGYIYNNQCPSCKRFIRAKKKIDDQTIKKFTREYKYQPMKIWHYSNGETWKKEPVGEEKVRIENWETKQEFYECDHCNHKWDSGQFDINLDEKTRPKNEHIKSDKKDPNDFSIS